MLYNVMLCLQCDNYLMEYITFRSMKIFVSFTVFYFLLCYYEGKVSGTALNDQVGDAAADLESKSSGKGEHLKEQIIDPDTYRNVSELIACKGYPLEEHTVVTEDGYILSMQRIPHGKNSHTERGDKEVVLLIHGELGDGKTWFLNPPGQGLGVDKFMLYVGYILPDAGYDVWIINCRGSTYSQKHVKYPKDSYRFWDWSFDEIAKYDVSATIDYVLNATGKEALHIIGYSRGNTVGFCLLSEFPEYNKKVKLLVALAPIAYIGHFKTAVRYFIPFKDEIADMCAPTRIEPENPLSVGEIFKAEQKASSIASCEKLVLLFVQGGVATLGINVADHGEFLPTNKATRIITEKFCEVQDAELCQNVLFAVAGQDKKQLNMTRVPIYSAQYPSSTSTRILVHFGQLYESKKFTKYDFGRRRNLKKYNQRCPPDYQPSRITSPVALFTSKNDKIADPTDVDILRKKLKSIVFDFCDPDDEYNHFDFIWAKDSHEKIYKPLLGLLSKY